MGTTSFPCGCSISRSMFGERDILYVVTCLEHAKDLQKELQAMAEKVLNIQKNIVLENGGMVY